MLIAMASQPQIQANRQNARKSTGPRSQAGKASPRSNRPCYREQATAAGLLERRTSRFNALKSGLHARSRVIPGEDAAELEALAKDYRERFQPDSPEALVLVDSLIAADWQLRRLRKIEAQLWERALGDAGDLAEAYIGNPVLDQVQRRIQTTKRNFRQNLKALQQREKQDGDAPVKAAKAETAANIWQGALARLVRESGDRQSGSFSSGQKAAGGAPASDGKPPE